MRVAGLALGMVFAPLVVSASETELRFETLAAAMTLWDVSLEQERADLSIASLEVVTALSPQTLQSWLEAVSDGVRLAALGRRDILDRIDALSPPPERSDLGILVLGADGSVIDLPPSFQLGQVRLSAGSDPAVLTAGDSGEMCSAGAGESEDCTGAFLTGTVTVAGASGELIYEIKAQP